MLYGLTGGIGCGKSTILEIFKGLGWSVYDADEICNSLYEDSEPELIKALQKRWGDRIFKDKNAVTINKSEIAEIVFNSKSELEWLTSIIHPLILGKALEEFKQKSCKEKLLFAVPLLFESGWDIYVDSVIAVWSPLCLQIERLRKRGWSEQEIYNRMANQLSAEEKLERADIGIINNGTIEYLKLQCMEVNIYAEKKTKHTTGRRKHGKKHDR